jgi:6-pyruvoyltetrahydropterin/6-carboxytetrahydropterin synthase
MVGDLTLKLNPFRKVSIDCEADKMIYLSEKFEFAAMHKLWNRDFSDKKNFEVFGKCANPSGHGHNYVIEVTVKANEGQDKFSCGEFEKVVDDEFVQEVDHKNLNEDTAFFKDNIPTVENIAVFAWEKLVGKFSNVKLHSVTIWETDRTSCTYYG